MYKFNKSQILVLCHLVVLLIITPSLPSSFRPTYMYFIFNFLIIALGAEAGLLSAFSKPLEDKKQLVSAVQRPTIHQENAPEKKDISSKTVGKAGQECNEKKAKQVEKSASEKIVIVAKLDKVEKCSSMPSLFYIGAGEGEAAEMEEEECEAEEEVGGISGKELFTKAETFIGNFYRQLNMQREES